ncbi:hypothetical protein Nepgr_033706 [Nepenthes gracilis]|uniref:Uncharacterized protein n=1 Tax=Nepenthes gracilis TaxID=150966 RepID=A0AAD3TMX7_NEPGR|nr:hypothetical protein Nepgr_033706 [Nepenthes gracilis]
MGPGVVAVEGYGLPGRGYASDALTAIWSTPRFSTGIMFLPLLGVNSLLMSVMQYPVVVDHLCWIHCGDLDAWKLVVWQLVQCCCSFHCCVDLYLEWRLCCSWCLGYNASAVMGIGSFADLAGSWVGSGWFSICCYFWVLCLHPILSLLSSTCAPTVTGFRLIADVDWPSLFEFCGDGAACWGVVDVTSLLHLTKVLVGVLGWLMTWPLPLLFWELVGRSSWAFHEPGLDGSVLLLSLRDYSAAGILNAICWFAESGL